MIDLLDDPEWRLNNLYYIKDKFQKRILLKANPIQSMLRKSMTGMDNILKARQVGISTEVLIQKLDRACFTNNYTVSILSHKRDSMEKLFSIVRRAHKYMHPDVKPVVEKGGGSKFELKFPELDSKIYCTMEAVSDTVNDLHVSEMALMSDAERVNTSFDAVPPGGKVSIETTCRGFNFYHDVWEDPNSPFKNHFFPWYLHPEYANKTGPLDYTDNEIELVGKALRLFNHTITPEQIAFRRFKIAQKGDFKNFLQEYPEDDNTCFISSGDSVFDPFIIQKLKTEVRPYKEVAGVRIYKEYEKDKRYVIGADPAEGVASDYSVAKVLEVVTREEVASFRTNKIKPGDFADKLMELGNLYHSGGRPKPMIVVERNNHGHAVLLKLDLDGYENIFTHQDGKAGWLQTKVTRPLMLDAIIDAVETGFTKINDLQTLNECLTLVDNNGKIEAEEGKNDDTIFAHGIALQVCIHHQSHDMYSNIEDYILI